MEFGGDGTSGLNLNEVVEVSDELDPPFSMLVKTSAITG